MLLDIGWLLDDRLLQEDRLLLDDRLLLSLTHRTRDGMNVVVMSRDAVNHQLVYRDFYT